MPQSTVDVDKRHAEGRVRSACARIVAERGEVLTDIALSYVCGYRRTFVFHVIITTPSEVIDLFVKAGRNLSDSVCEFVAREARLSTAVGQRFPTTESLGVIEVASHYPDLAILATRTVPGVRLDLKIVAALRGRSAAGARVATTAVEKCGRWLRAFQASWPREGTIDTEEILTGINRLLNRMTNSPSSRIPAEYFRQLRKTTTRLAARLSEEDRARVTRHDDYAPWNVMLDEHRIVVFDFPNVQPGARYHDMYQFDSALASLQNKLLISARQINELRYRFRMAFDENADNSPDRDQFYALQFGLVRLDALMHLHKPQFPKSVIVKHRTSREIKALMSICNNVL